MIRILNNDSQHPVAERNIKASSYAHANGLKIAISHIIDGNFHSDKCSNICWQPNYIEHVNQAMCTPFLKFAIVESDKSLLKINSRVRALKSTLDIFCNFLVRIFNMKIFTRLFNHNSCI